VAGASKLPRALNLSQSLQAAWINDILILDLWAIFQEVS
jgi:hypothetical protein